MSEPTILLIQPNERARLAMVARLEQAGFTVLTSNTALDGLAAIQREEIDLVLSEKELPGRDGIELTRLVRENTAYEDLPVMLITGKHDRVGACAGYGVGADDVVAKPFDTDVLIAKINRRLTLAGTVTALRHDNSILDTRVIQRAIELGEVRDELRALRAGKRA
ncbi:response regulator [Sphingomicrobium clamense]|uniref:Response regulator n=1 Tax=Sphingomicrobium clamense TaxID=2851013 RepID=A0ABS6V3G3_9SPHN|nr:response regulator [Sphingomicrobium sp. B8]MBW0144085.1 response regulator [Sphingomicrobium sp. B8]